VSDTQEQPQESNLCAICGRIKDLGRAIVEQMQAGKEGGIFLLCPGHPEQKKEQTT